jgi:hypothetical protein
MQQYLRDIVFKNTVDVLKACSDMNLKACYDESF